MRDDKLELGTLAQAYTLGYLNIGHGRDVQDEDEFTQAELLEPLVAGMEFAQLNEEVLLEMDLETQAKMDLETQAKTCYEAGAVVAREQKAQLN